MTPLELLRTILKRLTQRREQHANIGVLHSLDRRTLRDIGMDHYGITSVVFGQTSNAGEPDRDTEN